MPILGYGTWIDRVLGIKFLLRIDIYLFGVGGANSRKWARYALTESPQGLVQLASKSQAGWGGLRLESGALGEIKNFRVYRERGLGVEGFEFRAWAWRTAGRKRLSLRAFASWKGLR